MGVICRHRNATIPRLDERGEYRWCLECGARIPWAWRDNLALRLPRPTQPPNWEAFYRSLPIEAEEEEEEVNFHWF